MTVSSLHIERAIDATLSPAGLASVTPQGEDAYPFRRLLVEFDTESLGRTAHVVLFRSGDQETTIVWPVKRMARPIAQQLNGRKER